MVAPQAALGLAPRSSSAVLVTINAPRDAPRLLDRRRIDLVEGDLPGQAYHAAAALDLDEADALIERWASVARDAASRTVAEVLSGQADGYDVVAAGIVAAVRDVPPLSTVLRSHPMLHVAEGQLAREVLAEAAERAQLPVHYLPPKGPHDAVYAELAADLRRVAGVPWRKEHKLATIAALTALGAQAGSVP